MSENRIFISYRRADTDADANALYLTLAGHFGDEMIFKDVDNIPLGSNFRDAISMALEAADLMITLIGPRWLQGDNDGTNSLLDRENDFVRIELETAIRTRMTIVPVTVRGAAMPSPTDLPESCRDVAYLNAAEVEHKSWGRDIQPVIAAIEQFLDTADRRRELLAIGVASVQEAIDQRAWDDADAALAELRQYEDLGGGDLDELGSQVAAGRNEDVASRPAYDGLAEGTLDAGAPVVDAPPVESDDEFDAGASDERDIDLAEVTEYDDLSESPEDDGAEVGSSDGQRSEEQPSASVISAFFRRHGARILYLGMGTIVVVLAVLAVASITGTEPSSDDADLSEFETLALDGKPGTPAVTEDKIWIPAAAEDDILIVVSASTNNVLDSIIGAGSTRPPNAPAVSDGEVWAPGSGPYGETTVLSVSTNEILTTTTDRGAGAVTSYLQTPLVANNKVWTPVSSIAATEGWVMVRDAETYEQITAIDLGSGLVSTPVLASGKVWVPHGSRAGFLTAVDVETNEIVTTFNVGSDLTPAVANDKVWMPVSASSSPSSVAVIDAVTSEVITFVATADEGLLATPAVTVGKVWVPNLDAASVTIIDAETNEIIDTVVVGDGPSTPAVGNGKVWVPNYDSGTVTVIDAETNEVVATVKVGDGPVTPAVANNKVWVPNHDGESLSVIDAETLEVF